MIQIKVYIFSLLLCFCSLGQASDIFCEVSLNNNQWTESLGAKFPAQTRSEIMAHSPLLLYPRSLTYEQLMSLPQSDFKYRARKDPFGKKYDTLPDKAPVLSKFTALRVINLFKVAPKNSNYYFVGNGYYLSYLIAKSVFKGTPLENKIHFLHTSRDLAHKAIESNALKTLFTKLNLKGHSGPIVLIDSLLGKSKGDDHSLLKISNSVRNYLVDQGVPRDKAYQSVITIGMPEVMTGAYPNRTEDLATYRSEVGHKLSNEEHLTPFIDLNIDWGTAPFTTSYSSSGDVSLYYWNGKYKRLDSEGLPLGKQDFIAELLTEQDIKAVKHLLDEQTHKVEIYLKLIKAMDKNREKLKEEISRIFD